MAEKNKSKADVAKETVQKFADRLHPNDADNQSTGDASSSPDEQRKTPERAQTGVNKNVERKPDQKADPGKDAAPRDGLGEIRVQAEEVQGQEVPVTAGGDLDFSPRDGKNQEQVLVIPDNPDLYPVIRTVNDPADQQSQADAEQQRIMEARRQQGNIERDTPVTERELRRRMNEQPS